MAACFIAANQDSDRDSAALLSERWCGRDACKRGLGSCAGLYVGTCALRMQLNCLNWMWLWPVVDVRALCVVELRCEI